MSYRVWAVFAIVALACCLLPADERVELDRKAGRAQVEGLSIAVSDGLAGVRSLRADRVELWAQAPAFEIEIDAAAAPMPLRIDVLNCMREALLTTPEGSLAGGSVDGRAASCRYDIEVSGHQTLRFGPADSSVREPYAFAVLSDIQRGIDKVHEVFERINQDPELRFVVSTGDLVNTGVRRELVAFQKQLTKLEIPMFSTVGNHEMGAPAHDWHDLFGPFNIHYLFKGVAFSLVDSGNATIDPHVYDWLDGWLGAARDKVHVVLTHIPPLDPVGLRGGGFRSRKEGAKLMGRLADGAVDALFLGHIHSYYAFSAAGVPSYISGGGGAIQERFDGIERHYLKVRVTPARIDDVAIVRVDY